jgi:hypothetical protein
MRLQYSLKTTDFQQVPEEDPGPGEWQFSRKASRKWPCARSASRRQAEAVDMMGSLTAQKL